MCLNSYLARIYVPTPLYLPAKKQPSQQTSLVMNLPHPSYSSYLNWPSYSFVLPHPSLFPLTNYPSYRTSPFSSQSMPYPHFSESKNSPSYTTLLLSLFRITTSPRIGAPFSYRSSTNQHIWSRNQIIFLLPSVLNTFLSLFLFKLVIMPVMLIPGLGFGISRDIDCSIMFAYYFLYQYAMQRSCNQISKCEIEFMKISITIYYTMIRSKISAISAPAYSAIINNTRHKFVYDLRSQSICRRNVLGGQNRYHMSSLKHSKTDAYYRLCRFHQPIGAWLLYWPTAWGVCLGSVGVADPYLLILFLMGSWTSRSAGCIVNDYLDRQFDKKVQRTKSRPLASGQVTTKQAGTLLFLNLCGGLFVLCNMNPTALFTTLGFVALGGLYPLAKRYTDYPQFVLGMGFNSGIIIGSLTANPQLIPAVIPMYLGGIAWTMIYDTVYAYQDIDDDLKIGIKSTAVTWHDKNPKQIMEQFGYLMIVCHLCLPLLDADFMVATPFILLGDAMLIKQIRNLDLKDKLQCSNFFKKNNLYGVLVFCSLLVMGLVKSYRQYCKQNAQKKRKS